MLSFFNATIKPLNDKLGEDLGIKTIKVKHVPSETKISTVTWVKTPWGARIAVKTEKLRDYRALGLSL